MYLLIIINVYVLKISLILSNGVLLFFGCFQSSFLKPETGPSLVLVDKLYLLKLTCWDCI